MPDATRCCSPSSRARSSATAPPITLVRGADRAGGLRGRAGGGHRAAGAERRRRATPSTSSSGYTCLNDVSARDLQVGTGSGCARKASTRSADGSLDRDRRRGPGRDDAARALPGERRDAPGRVDGRAGPCRRGAHRLLLAVFTLEPGDVIATGTPGASARSAMPPVFLRDGDVVEVEIEGVGTLRNACRVLRVTPRAGIQRGLEGSGRLRTVLDAKSEVLWIVSEPSTEQVQSTHVLGVSAHADPDDDRLARGQPQCIDVHVRQSHAVDGRAGRRDQPSLEDAELRVLLLPPGWRQATALTAEVGRRGPFAERGPIDSRPRCRWASRGRGEVPRW